MHTWVPAASRHRPAVYEADGTVTTWVALAAEIAERADGLRDHGIKRGDRVWVNATTVRDELLSLLAVQACGAVPTIPHRGWPATAAAAAAAKTGAAFRICADAVETLSAPSSSADARSADLSDILFSSGSTGAPKAVAHAFEGHRASALAVTTALGFTDSHAWALDLPLSHVGGLCVVARACLTGGAMVLPSESLAAMDRPESTHLSVVPTHLQRVIDDTAREQAWSEKEAILVGGSAIPASLAERAKASRFASKIVTSYGMTEVTSTIATAEPGDVGGWLTPLPHVQIRVDADIVALKSPAVAFNGRGETLGDWFVTSDRGQLDATGRLRVLGRAGRMFISGGENVTPERVESALEAAGAEKACVVAVADAQWGHVGIAFVSTSNAITELRQSISSVLAPFERPKLLLPWPPGMSETKPVYRELSALAADAWTAQTT